MADISRAETDSGTTEFRAGDDVTLALLMGKPVAPRTLSDIDDPLEGCDGAVKSITFGRVGDPAGTHTRERNLGVTMRAFGYLPEWPRDWMGSAPWVHPDGDEEGREDDAL
jgi:hypothetical protein